MSHLAQIDLGNLYIGEPQNESDEKVNDESELKQEEQEEKKGDNEEEWLIEAKTEREMILGLIKTLYPDIPLLDKMKIIEILICADLGIDSLGSIMLESDGALQTFAEVDEMIHNVTGHTVATHDICAAFKSLN